MAWEAAAARTELVVDARVQLGNGGRVAHHRDGAHDLGEVATRHDGRRLVCVRSQAQAHSVSIGRGAVRGTDKAEEWQRDGRSAYS